VSRLLCRYRHLLLDLAQLLPHSKKDAKLDTKSDRGVLNEVADMKARPSAQTWCPVLQSWGSLSSWRAHCPAAGTDQVSL